MTSHPDERCRRVNATDIVLLRGDITAESVDAIVNAAKSSLAGGGGVDGAIHRAGGPSIMEELRQIKRLQKGCPTGSAVVTGAGNLKARFVIHAVGPMFRGGRDGEPELLASAYRKSLELAAEAGARTVAFPSISTGIYGYPVEQAAPLALATVADFCRLNNCFSQVRFVLFDGHTLSAFEKALSNLTVS